jgi:tetratricopeptide (TPR) repeat protein
MIAYCRTNNYRHPRNVLPLVNKSLAIFQWKQDIGLAESLCKEALDIDSDCDVAVATLAQLSLQQGKIEEAITWFERSSSLARTEGELINAVTCEPLEFDLLRNSADIFRRACKQGAAGFLEKLPRVCGAAESDGAEHARTGIGCICRR